jgi:hypothetical protein
MEKTRDPDAVLKQQQQQQQQLAPSQDMAVSPAST